MATLLTELIVIVLINLFTLATFARNRRLRKRSTYLVINLTIADLLLGVAAILLPILEPHILESHNILGEHFNWYAFLYLTLDSLFPAASLANLSLISLERLHATIYPCRHCLIREQVYFTEITFSWLLPLLFASMMAIVVVLRAQFTLVFYVFASYCFITVLIITVSYVIIILNVKSSPQSNIFGSKLLTEKKLSITLFVMTVASFLTILPLAVWIAMLRHIWGELSPAIAYRFHLTFSALYLCNSIVNPIIYALRMQEFRKAARKLCCYRESMRMESIELPAV
ncbi:unnamed protein product [Porites evermanni]|uniref:G-protein coupled receptors family 1 profile domain-containing protein n=1 Tax=Porites evermanni TaxID=104178 RepID=A0ABN8LXC5_9CNID|nr:unnamed protein product [Porites evermanni]